MSKYQNDLQKIKQNLLGVKEDTVRSKARLLIRVLESTNISLGCDRAGIQRRTFYNHIKVLRENGYCIHALKGKSRRPHNSPNKTSPEVERQILEIREDRQNGGAIIAALYRRQTGKYIAPSTVDKVLRRNNVCNTHKRKKANPHDKRYSAAHKHDRAQADTVYLGIENNNGNKVYAVTLIDDCSRNVFVHVCEEKSAYEATQALHEYVNRYGKPKLIQTDNGVEFTNRYTSELNAKRQKQSRAGLFETTLQSLGVRHHLIRPRTPQHNGKIERFHRTMKQEAKLEKLDGLLQSQIEKGIIEYVRYYNEERPHSSIRKLTPKQVFDKGYLEPQVA